MTRTQAEEHQKKHGFFPVPVLAEPQKSCKGMVSEARESNGAKTVSEAKSLGHSRGGENTLVKSRMNKTEAEAALILESDPKIYNWRFEAVKVRVGDGCFYVPDFFVEREGKKPLFIEIKGFMRDDARVKFLAAKELHDWAEWQMWRKAKSGWEQIL